MKSIKFDGALSKAWGQFFSLLFHPGVIIPTLITAVFIVLSVTSTNKAMTAVLAGLGSISAGVAGGFFVETYKEQSGNTLLVKKGRSAVRNLHLISAQLSRISSRASEGDDKPELKLSEVAQHLLTTEDNITAGIEDWIDLVPELKETSEINRKIAEKDTKIRELMKDKKELSEKKNEDKADQASKIAEKDAEIEKLRNDINDLQAKQASIAVPTLSGTLTSSGTISSVVRPCNSCGRMYLGRADDIDGRCPSCRALGLQQKRTP